MAKFKPLKCDKIIERYSALGLSEVALCLHHRDEANLPWYVVDLISYSDDGKSVTRQALSGLFPTKAALEHRLMDFHSGVVQAQYAMGQKPDHRMPA